MPTCVATNWASRSDMTRLSTDDTNASPGLAPLREGEGRRALITGLHGFTGYFLAQELTAAGYRVFGTMMPGEAVGPDMFAVDLCDRDAVAAMVAEVRPDVVAHLAGIAFVGHANVEAIYRVNVVGTRNLLEALASGSDQPTSVLLASSANIYGNASVPVIDEDVPPAPANDYAVSKLAMEYMARLWMDKLPITIVRPFNYTGVGQADNFLLPKIVSHFRRNEARIELGNFAIARDSRMCAWWRASIVHPDSVGGVEQGIARRDAQAVGQPRARAHDGPACCSTLRRAVHIRANGRQLHRALPRPGRPPRHRLEHRFLEQTDASLSQTKV
jgi:nucleoside-diphosphate-sugar epimerase